MTFRVINIIVLCLCFNRGDGQAAGESCTQDGVAGVCTNLSKCAAALADSSIWRKLHRCGFDNMEPVICCVSAAAATTTTTTTTAVPVATTPRPGTTTTEYIPQTYDYRINIPLVGGCAELSPSLTSAKTTSKSWNKCIDYQHELVYPCERGVSLTGDMSRANHCNRNADELIVGGMDAAVGEFPHMALLGYGDTAGTAQWKCGGTIISDKFILTAGHCTYDRESGAVTFAIVGTLKRSESLDSSKVYRIRRIIKHPDYKPPKKYNDIALLETEVAIKLDPNVVPACLDVGGAAPDDRASATGWGTTTWRGSTSETLQKVTLSKFTDEECRRKFPEASDRNMKEGFNNKTQSCYGDYTLAKDTCQGDSGGPLQTKNPKIHCMYTVIGVTSFGKACGIPDQPGIYTKVSHYVPWIESIVWA